MRFGKFLSIIVLTILMFSCASTSESENIIPDWFSNPPSDNKESKYYTVSVQASIFEDIEELAGITFYNNFVNSIGLSEQESQLEDFAEFRDEIVGLFKGGEVAGFTLIEKQINPLGTEDILYALIELKLDNLEEIEDTIAEVLRSGLSSSLFSDEAEEHIRNGDIYKGTLSYIKAALESAESSNFFITDKNLSSAIEQLENITMEKNQSPQTLSVGKNGIFSAVLNSGAVTDSSVWNDVSVKVSFRDRKKGSVIGDRFAQLRSDETGLISFVHPSPGFTGEGRVFMELDLFRDTGSLKSLEENHREKLEELKKTVEEISVLFDFDIVSSAPFVPTGILIIDADFLRKPLDSGNMAEGLMKGLNDAGFSVSLLQSDSKSILDLTEPEFLRDLPYMVDSDIKRVIFGVAQIVDFDDSAAGFTVVTEAEIQVINLDSGEILFKESMSKRVQGGESQSTINTSFKELGKSFSSLLVDKLP